MLKRLLLASLVCIGGGCSGSKPMQVKADPSTLHPSDTRTSIALSDGEQQIHRDVMLQHLESVQVIVAALADQDYELAKGLTESHLGFVVHRAAMANQHSENFPPAYHDLAMAHHQAAEDLADVIPSRDIKQILPHLSAVLKACVACHLEYKLAGRTSN